MIGLQSGLICTILLMKTRKRGVGMSTNRIQESFRQSETIHQHYMDIINALPDIVYWVDIECNLIGCNTNFVTLLGLNSLREFKGTPYQQMKKHAKWSEKRAEEFKLDDMKVIFSGKSLNKVEEQPVVDKHGDTLYFQSNRVLMYDDKKKIVGLIVVLTDISAFKKLDVVKKTVPKNKSKIKPVMIDGHLPNVLMIEDNVVAQHAEKALLTGLNCQVDIAGTGDMALKLFDPGKYDLVLMDIGLGDTSGYVVAKQLRNMEKNTKHHVPIIALTGYQADVVKSDCEKYFMEGVISKPLTSEQAEQIIKHYVYHMDVDVQGLKDTLYTHHH